MADVFVSSPFNEQFDAVFDTIKSAAAERNLEAVRIDQSLHLSPSITDAIHCRIRESQLVVADITGNNPNVLNEIGLAQALGKPLVIITRDEPASAPFNVRSLQLKRYRADDLGGLFRIVKKAILETTSDNELIRSMLVPSTLGRPSRDSRFVIAASPLSWRRASGRSGGYKKLRRTSSDYVGIRGIMQSFGLLFGFDVLPDNIDPEDCDNCVLREAMNLYCIASPKANHWTGTILSEYSDRWVPGLEFRADPSSRDLRNVELSIFCDGDPLRPAGWCINEDGDRYRRDFGLIVRGPNPYHEDRMVVIMAGRSSLGTEAACMALTDPRAIGVVRKQLVGLNTDLENHKQPFWAIASLKRAIGDSMEESIPETLTVERVQAFAWR